MTQRRTRTPLRKSHALALGVGLTSMTMLAPAGLGGASPASAAVQVHSTSALLGALGTARSGDTITLSSGRYTSLWRDRWTTNRLNLSGVTIQASSRAGTVLDGLTLKGVTGLTLRSLTLVNDASSAQSVI